MTSKLSLNYPTTEIVEELKGLYKKYHNGTLGSTLKSIRTFKKGIYSTTTVWPAINVCLKKVRFGGFRSGGKRKIFYDFDIKLGVKGTDRKSVDKYLKETCPELLNVFYDSSYPTNYKLADKYGDSRIFDFTAGETDYFEYNKDFFEGVVSFTLSGWHYVRDFVVTSTVGDYTQEQVKNETFDILRNNVDAKVYYNYQYPPVRIGNGTVICINDRKKDRNRETAGVDRPDLEFDILVWSKLSPFERLLEFNLDKTDEVFYQLEKYQDLNGKAMWTNIREINYGYNQDVGLYGSQIVFEVKTRDVMPNY